MAQLGLLSVTCNKNITFHKQLHECTTIECSVIITLCGGEHAPKARFFSMIYVVKSNMMLVNVVCL